MREADKAEDRGLVGRETEPTTVTVDPNAVREFARAVGETDPLYFDSEAARAAGYADVVAPPTYPVALMTESVGTDLCVELGLKLPAIAQAEQEFEYYRPVVGGEKLSIRGRIVDAWREQGRGEGREVVVVEAIASDVGGTPVFATRITMISKRSIRRVPRQEVS